VKLSVIVPVFNEEQTSGAVIERVFAVDDARRQLVSDARRERPLRRPPHGHGNRVQGVALAGRRICEAPIGYQPRRKDKGKKIRWVDGLDALYVLFRCRLNRGK
jgi:hypothetical protein